jgi:hypothetical protein
MCNCPKPRNGLLTVLFCDVLKKPVTKFSAAEMDQEAILMEALADAAEDAKLDDGGIEESGDEYELRTQFLKSLNTVHCLESRKINAFW